MNIGHYLLSTLLLLGITGSLFASYGNGSKPEDPYATQYVLVQDTIPLQERYGDFMNESSNNPFDLNDPSAIEQNVEYDAESGYYIITETIGDDYYRPPTYMTFEEYMEWNAQQQEQAYFEQVAGYSDEEGGTGLRDPIEAFDIKRNLLDRLFGGSNVDIRPQGEIGLTFGVDFQKVENPTLTLRQQRQGGFDFDMNIRMNVTGKIGEKLNLSTNYNTQATFDFDNQMKLQYDSEAFSEDDIVKKIEAGNVSMPLKGSLIQGSQSLFGLKTELRFGRLGLTLLASQQKSRRQNIQIQGGSQIQEFEVYADEYDENRHFFLTHYNREVFEEAMENLPQINSLFKVKRIEVWVTNDRNDPDNVRDIVALADLGEATEITNNNPNFQAPIVPRNPDITGQRGLPGRQIGDGAPDNGRGANDIYFTLQDDERAQNLDESVNILENRYGLRQASDFEKVSARLLSQNEYSYNADLGFISLNVNLQPDQVLGVAFEYDYNGKTFRVGDFAQNAYSADTLEVLFVKMLKSTTQRVDVPAWDLMMKNVYSVGAFQVNQEDFKLDIFYEDPGAGQKRFLPDTRLAGVPLLQVFNLDNLNVQGDPCPDGIFDFVPNITINPRNGRIMFPVLEPFSDALVEQIESPNLKRRYDYFHLYDSTVVRAREYQEFNRFTIRGRYKSSVSSEISLGSFNLPQGSVTVRAGGQTLIEGSDYEVDYNIGRVKILNEAYLNSGVPVNVSFEDNTLFGFQTQTLLGVRADYEVNKNFNIGATYMQLFERPFTQKVNIGDDPINNRVYGLDFNYSTEAPWLTRAVDAIPFIDTKEPSSIALSAEAAYLKPGHSRAINQGRDEDGSIDRDGVVYVDDFEGSTSGFDLRTQPTAWILSSVPQDDADNNNPLFPESQFIDNTISGVNRALLNWYRVDQTVRNQDDQNNPYAAAIPQDEVFPNLTTQPGLNNIIQTLDLSYYPDERGPYNFDLPDGTEYSEGLLTNGGLNRPETRWGGIMRALNTNDFQAANIEFIEFWMMDPFLINSGNSGDLYFNLGNVSEDILRDSRKFFENGLPTEGTNTNNNQTDQTAWSRIPRAPAITQAFDADTERRQQQDVGFDGLNDAGEQQQFAEYLNAIEASGLSDDAKGEIQEDPSNDNYRFFRTYPDGTSVFDRYKRFNNSEGNTGEPEDGRPTSSTNIPDTEDINRDNTLNETESYFQYRVPLRDDNGDGRLDIEDNPFVTDRLVVDAQGGERVWYRFKVPLDNFDNRVGAIQDFRSIRFIRMFMTGFEEEVTLRFARLELVRNQWRRYLRDLQIYEVNEDGTIDLPIQDNEDETLFEVNAVNIEENSEKIPFRYILPPGIEREQSTSSTFPDILQNEQALSMEICDLAPDDGRSIYKNILLDMRVYKRLRMFVHAEAANVMNDLDAIEDGDLSIFMRIGSDFENNYYEYEIPLTMSRDLSFAYTDPAYKDEVWKALNNFDIPIERFKEIKIARNNSGAALNRPYTEDDPSTINGTVRDGKISIVGNPSLGFVKGIMIGIVNRSDQTHCFEIWVNELRLSGFDERAGFAAIGKLDAQLADFGTATFATNYSSIGWGTLEQKLLQRAREEVFQFDVATNLELGKFLPEKSGVKIPFYAQYSQTVRTPEFDPYDLDIPLKEKLRNETDGAKRDSIRKQAIDFTEIKGYNFTNVRKERTGGKGKAPMPWNIENFSLTYAYNETNRTDPIIEKDQIKRYNGSLDYKYNRSAKYITPFKKLFKKDKYVKLISEFNFNPLPNSFTFNTAVNRQIQATTYRFTDGDPRFSTFYNKQFTWDRNYNLQWDLTKSLKLSFNATNYAVIDELKTFDPETNQFVPESERKAFIWDNIQDFGRTKNYSHQITANYTLPFKLIPFMDWVTVKAQYRGDYSWNAAALNTESLGNVIQNGQRRQLNGDLNFETLYNKSKYLKKINSKARGRKSRSRRGGGADQRVSKNGNKDDKGGKKKDKKNKEPSKLERALVRPLMMLRKARLTYGQTYSTIVPGYTPFTEVLGQAPGFDAPGWDFVAGLQPQISTTDDDRDWLRMGAEKGWFTTDVLLNQDVQQTYTESFDARVTIEPYSDFRIEIEAKRQFTENLSLQFKDTLFTDFGVQGDPFDDIRHLNPREFGSFTISYYAMGTMFDSDITGLFARFENNRSIISKRLGTELGETRDHIDDGADYTYGYGRYQQDVLVPAFLAAYTNKDPNSVEISEDYTEVLFKELPRPNWNVTLRSLEKLGFMKEIFTRFEISHGYNATLTVNSFQTNRQFRSTSPSDLNTETGSYFARFEIPGIVITEQFSPLIGVRTELRNGMNFDVDFKRSRNLQMDFRTKQLSETKTSEYVIGFGFTMKNVELAFLQGGKKKKRRSRRKKDDDKNKGPAGRQDDPQGSDMNFAFNFSLRDDITINHLLDQGVAEPTRGLRQIQISPSVDYDINKRLNVRLFFDYSKTTPKTSASFPITNTRGGVTVTFSLN